ncbi:unnamed protein product [Prunus armeniaca]|uniref:Uncharacterized protein n=1 Tax=Prunus armeniaca TaxID=36596 RepID=A0A6J5XXP1_PRUAR|nr:unnamed protein product [Prunus armeniaca]
MELDYRCPNDLENPSDIAKLKKCTSEERVYMFLIGLYHNLDQVCSRALAIVPLSYLNEAYVMVHREAQ